MSGVAQKIFVVFAARTANTDKITIVIKARRGDRRRAFIAQRITGFIDASTEYFDGRIRINCANIIVGIGYIVNFEGKLTGIIAPAVFAMGLTPICNKNEMSERREPPRMVTVGMGSCDGSIVNLWVFSGAITQIANSVSARISICGHSNNSKCAALSCIPTLGAIGENKIFFIAQTRNPAYSLNMLVPGIHAMKQVILGRIGVTAYANFAAPFAPVVCLYGVETCPDIRNAGIAILTAPKAIGVAL
ncbi:MAG: hypothetical protein JKX88_03470 [Marinicaulis sp.]|nr:hypothetical protein [Marinicaulis sp.]